MVASQLVAVAVAATIEPVFDLARGELAVLPVMSLSVGVALCVAGLKVSLRLMLYEFGPEQPTPPYFVSMGALAITVLAGARIVRMTDAPMVAVTRDPTHHIDKHGLSGRDNVRDGLIGVVD